MSQKLRDIDAAAPRARLPPRALPDSVRSKLKLAPRAGAPAPRRNWEVPPTITTKEALFGKGTINRRQSDRYNGPGMKVAAWHPDEKRRQSLPAQATLSDRTNMRRGAGSNMTGNCAPKANGFEMYGVPAGSQRARKPRASSFADAYEDELNVGPYPPVENTVHLKLERFFPDEKDFAYKLKDATWRVSLSADFDIVARLLRNAEL